ncbi:MAG: response regulator [Pseudomonadales bacterium]|nr:response regulator [Pseudomonadales bacterium]
MGKIQYRILAFIFLGFVIGIAALSASVHVTLGNLIREDIKSSLETIYTYKSQYLLNFIASEQDSLDNVYLGPELLSELHDFTALVGQETDAQYVDRLNDLRQQLLAKIPLANRAHFSLVEPNGTTVLSSNLEFLRQTHSAWHAIDSNERINAQVETQAFLITEMAPKVILVRSLYLDGQLFGHLVLEKDISEQHLFDLSSSAGNYQFYLYDAAGNAFLQSYQGRFVQRIFKESDKFHEGSRFSLEEDGWSPFTTEPMVGAWGWQPLYGFGIVIVAESHSVFRILHIVRSINAAFLFCIIAASLIIAWFFNEYRKHRLYLEQRLENAIELQAQDLSNERQEKQSLVEALFQNSSDAYFVITKDKIIDCNPASVDMFDLKTRELLVGKHPFQFSPPFQAAGEVSLESSEELLDTAFDKGFLRFEWQFETHEKTRLFCLVTITIVKFYGQMVGIMVLQNMTQAIEAEKNLRDSERKSRAILNATSHLLFVLDPRGNIVDLNSSAADWLDREREDLLNSTYWEVARWRLDKPLIELTKDSFESVREGEPNRFEADILSGDERHYFDFVLTPILDELGTLVMVILEAYDISFQRKAAVAEKDARKLAEEVSQTKTNFLANMSHEIRTPMNAIMGLTKLCLKTALNNRQRTMLESIDQASETLLNILNDILDFSKVESGKLEIELVTFSISDVLQTVSGLFALKAEEKGIEFIVNNRCGSFNLIGDPLRIQQVLMNLCSNAIKFTDKGEVLLSVQLIRKTDDRGVFRFSVEDTGVGLSKEQKSKLFEAFSQADSSTTRRFGGTGLGLAISKELIELMGGKISVDSEPNQGSTFYFDLPLALLDDGEDPFQNSFENRTQLIAIVDDNLVCVEVEKKIVRKLGYDVEVYNSAESLLAHLNECGLNSPDLILMDWEMPGLDGCEAAVRIKQNMGERAPAIVLVTGVSNELSPEHLEQYSLDGFVIKPVNPDVLSHVIDEAFQKRKTFVSMQQNSEVPLDNVVPKQSVRVLVVEDNDINQMVVRNFLKETGIDSVVVANGREAVDCLELQSEKFDAVLMDLQMPVMDGFTATEIIRRHYSSEELPVIAMTANVLAPDRERAKTIGMNDLISKPIDFEAFEWVLSQWIDLPKSFVDKPIDAHGVEVLSVDEHVDYEFGLRQLGNDQNLYRSLLVKFREEFPNNLHLLRAAFEEQQFVELENIAHRVKGAAGNVGLNSLKKTLQTVEDMARARRPSETDLTHLADNWRDVDKAIQRVIASFVDEVVDPSAEQSKEEMVHYLNYIADRLHRHEVLPMDEVREIKSKLINHFDAYSVTQFVKAVESFQRETALELLVNFVEQLLNENME